MIRKIFRFPYPAPCPGCLWPGPPATRRRPAPGERRGRPGRPARRLLLPGPHLHQHLVQDAAAGKTQAHVVGRDQRAAAAGADNQIALAHAGRLDGLLDRLLRLRVDVVVSDSVPSYPKLVGRLWGTCRVYGGFRALHLRRLRVFAAASTIRPVKVRPSRSKNALIGSIEALCYPLCLTVIRL